MSHSDPSTNSSDMEELSEWERDAMKRMENKFSLSPEEESPYKDLRLIHKQLIRGSHFLAYESDDSDQRIYLYSEKNRFRAVIAMLIGSWAPDLNILLELIQKAESDQLDSYEEDELDTFGIRVNEDSYVVGYLTAGSSPIVASKDLLLQILEFYVESMAELPESFSKEQVEQCRLTLTEIRSSLESSENDARDS
tara:strand:- start:61681 stop:62265 length:585 start_codon:yes stop_codon:yes gene_type:complete